jgi:alpha-mannosidase
MVSLEKINDQGWPNSYSFVIENAFLCAVFTKHGRLIGLFDKNAGRECIGPGRSGNTFVLYEDMANYFDAWDVDIFHLEKRLPTGDVTSAQIVESGPLLASIPFRFEISPQSTIEQTVSLDTLSKRPDFACVVNWHEKHKFLKVEFPLTIRAMYAAHESQSGHAQRPTHFNNSNDLARFEVPAHKWADLSEPDYGVARLNDCKYGYSAQAYILRLSLFRSPSYPDPKADQGSHKFRFTLSRHRGNPQSAGVTEEANRFNVPVLIDKAGGHKTQRSFIWVDNPAVIMDTIKH